MVSATTSSAVSWSPGGRQSHSITTRLPTLVRTASTNTTVAITG